MKIDEERRRPVKLMMEGHRMKCNPDLGMKVNSSLYNYFTIIDILYGLEDNNLARCSDDGDCFLLKVANGFSVSVLS
ncbi:hypothetical protein L1887_19114 [Cichorium endivia]|nr:hypothetical protein L1887_19114 [Cichorium endivia]